MEPRRRAGHIGRPTRSAGSSWGLRTDPPTSSSSRLPVERNQRDRARERDLLGAVQRHEGLLHACGRCPRQRFGTERDSNCPRIYLSSRAGGLWSRPRRTQRRRATHPAGLRSPDGRPKAPTTS